jgi:hypothetical protein
MIQSRSSRPDLEEGPMETVVSCMKARSRRHLESSAIRSQHLLKTVFGDPYMFGNPGVVLRAFANCETQQACFECRL